MKRLLLIPALLLSFAVLADNPPRKPAKKSSALLMATCKGADPCRACKNCKYCKRCAKNGGKCGVCK